jgi:electron transport complex protein RnfG
MKKLIIIPTIAIILAAAVLFGLAFGLKNVAEKNAQEQFDAQLLTLLPGSKSFVEEEYTGEDANIRKVYKAENGYVIETAVQGYVDEIVMLVGVSNEGTVTGLVIRDMHETPGVGTKALMDWEFLAQFLKSEGDAQIGTNVDGISGATVTSKAVAKSVNSAVAFVTGADADSGATG